MADLVGRSGVDIAKGMIATGVGTLVAVGVSAMGFPLIAVGGAFAVVGFLASLGLDWIDNEWGISDLLVEKLKEID
ncbi:hypothetical protein [Vibrio spartinae]|uniref:Uncharacterized protein n=1 Tax=Vibrio spartinae TaxID=1918945 RepID=A0A1N6M5B0_9VIBR|nr:hypothetical protein [Vibrio spartinae]SIO94536.1 hypothetical protein VSP9026_02247 [Vibrio spartinae]